MKTQTELNNYGKFINVLKIIFNEASEDSPISISQIQTILERDFNTSIDKRTIDNIVQSFCDMQDDYEITKLKKSHNQIFYYFSIVPTITFGEAKAIVDMVYSSKFFNEYTKDMFLKRMKENFNKHINIKLEKNIYTHLAGNENDDSFYKVFEQLSTAIYNNKKITFDYSKPLPAGKKMNSAYKEVWPIDTYCWNNTFYVYCWIPNNDRVQTFRIDFIKNLVLENCFIPSEEIKEKTRDLILDSINAYGPKRYVENLTITFNNELYSNIIDKFGKNTIKTKYIDEKESSVTIHNCPISSQFYAWIIGFKGKVKITAPQEEVEQFIIELQTWFPDLKTTKIEQDKLL